MWPLPTAKGSIVAGGLVVFETHTGDLETPGAETVLIATGAIRGSEHLGGYVGLVAPQGGLGEGEHWDDMV